MIKLNKNVKKNETLIDELNQLKDQLERQSSELIAIQKRESYLLQEINYYSADSFAASESQRQLEETIDANQKFTNELIGFNQLIETNLKNRYRDRTQLELELRQSESEGDRD